MNDNRRSTRRSAHMENIFSYLLMSGFFILIDCLALVVSSTFEATGVNVFEESSNPLDLVFFFLTIFLVTGAILFLSKFRKHWVHGIFLGAI